MERENLEINLRKTFNRRWGCFSFKDKELDSKFFNSFYFEAFNFVRIIDAATMCICLLILLLLLSAQGELDHVFEKLDSNKLSKERFQEFTEEYESQTKLNATAVSGVVVWAIWSGFCLVLA